MVRYIIVDDETAAHDNIADYSSNLSDLLLVQHCYNAFEAIECLNKEEVDLIFLDINMPKLSGFDFLRTLQNPPKIIVTSAHRDFALEGYELNVSDYLLKPFSYQRFITAVNKVIDQIADDREGASLPKTKTDHIFIKVNKKHLQVRLDDILIAEAFGNYVKVHLADQIILTHQTLTSFINLLPPDHFIRVHKSFIIARDKIKLIEGSRLFVGDLAVPIGKIYRPNVDKLLE